MTMTNEQADVLGMATAEFYNNQMSRHEFSRFVAGLPADPLKDLAFEVVRLEPETYAEAVAPGGQTSVMEAFQKLEEELEARLKEWRAEKERGWQRRSGAAWAVSWIDPADSWGPEARHWFASPSMSQASAGFDVERGDSWTVVDDDEPLVVYCYKGTPEAGEGSGHAPELVFGQLSVEDSPRKARQALRSGAALSVDASSLEMWLGAESSAYRWEADCPGLAALLRACRPWGLRPVTRDQPFPRLVAVEGEIWRAQPLPLNRPDDYGGTVGVTWMRQRRVRPVDWVEVALDIAGFPVAPEDTAGGRDWGKLGIELRPKYAKFVGVNLDHHGSRSGEPAACEQALAMPLPRTGFVIPRAEGQDADVFAALGVFRARQLGLEVDVERVTEIGEADRRGFQVRRPDMWSDTTYAIWSLASGEVRRDAVASATRWLTGRDRKGARIASADLRERVARLESEMSLEWIDQGHGLDIALVTVTTTERCQPAQFAYRQGARCALVHNPEARKFTISLADEQARQQINLERLCSRLNEADPATETWGGNFAAGIIGSPAGGSELETSEIVENLLYVLSCADSADGSQASGKESYHVVFNDMGDPAFASCRRALADGLGTACATLSDAQAVKNPFRGPRAIYRLVGGEPVELIT